MFLVDSHKKNMKEATERVCTVDSFREILTCECNPEIIADLYVCTAKGKGQMLSNFLDEPEKDAVAGK
jgi:hypothetical protein